MSQITSWVKGIHKKMGKARKIKDHGTKSPDVPRSRPII
jgi:hypothetical protein